MLNPHEQQRKDRNDNKNSNLPFYLQNKTDNNRMPKRINDNFINDGFSFENAVVDKNFNEYFGVKYKDPVKLDKGVNRILQAYRGFYKEYEFCVYEAEYVWTYGGQNHRRIPCFKNVVFSSIKLRNVNIPEFKFTKYSNGCACCFILAIPHTLLLITTIFAIPYLIIQSLLDLLKLNSELIETISKCGSTIIGILIIFFIFKLLRKSYVESHIYLRMNGFDKKYSVDGLEKAKLNKFKLEKIFNHLPICQRIDELYPKFGDFECRNNCIQTMRDGNLTEKDVIKEAVKVYEYAKMFDELLIQS